MEQFKTSGTSGAKKIFNLSGEQMSARAALLSSTKGAGFQNVQSFYTEYDPTSELMRRLGRYAADAGVALYRPTGDNSKTVAQFAANKIEGLIASPPRLLNLARSKIGHKFKYILSTGSLLLPEVCKEVRIGLLADGGEMYTSYATSEFGSTISLGTAEQVEAIRGCVGKPVEGVTVEIDCGEVRVKGGPHMIAGYTDKKITDKYFLDGWFYPGDKGEIRDGLLILLGRVSG